MLKRYDTDIDNNIVQEKIVDCDYWSRMRDEERKKQREKEMDLDNWLFDSEEEKEEYYKRRKAIENEEEMEFSEEYYNYKWDDAPVASDDDKIINRYDFYNKDYKDQQYYIYKQLVNISSLLSDIKEVLSDGNKTR